MYEINGFFVLIRSSRKEHPHYRPYPKPTLVDAFKRTKALEKTMLKELGKLTL
jgi:hypothetical protein